MEKENTKTLVHWRKMIDTDYIGSHDFQPNQEIIVKIESVKVENVKNGEGKFEDMRICRFIGGKKPLILNKTNAKAIAKSLASPYVEDWIGKAITLHVVPVMAFGEKVDAVRVKYIKP